MKREIINIDEALCDGCGNCVPNCHEGALQIIDQKAVLVSDLMCDGLGACIGHCPAGALTIEEREAEPYDEVKVMALMVKKGKNVVVAHLKHLKDHNEREFLKQGVKYLWDHKDELEFHPAEVVEAVHDLAPVSERFRVPESAALNTRSVNGGKNVLRQEAPGVASQKVIPVQKHHHGGGCPGSRSAEINKQPSVTGTAFDQPSELTHWPVQLHLINPNASFFKNADLLVAADCSAFAAGNFHSQYLRGKKLVIACPKLDQGMDIYVEKLRHLIDGACINSITVLRMEVPCCGGLTRMAAQALKLAERKVDVKEIVLSAGGERL